MTGAVVAAVGAAGAAAAIDPGDYRTKQRDIILPAETPTTAKVRCPKRHRVVPGGAFVHPAGSRSPDADTALNAAVPSSAPAKGARGWSVGALKGAGDAQRLHLVAVCAPRGRLRGATRVREQFEIPNGEAGGGTAECPGRERIVTGGVVWHQSGSSTALSAMVRTSSSTPAQGLRGWYGDGHNFTAGVLRLDVIAICLPKRRIGDVTRRSKDVPYPAYSEAFGRTVPCPAGTRVLTGGASWHSAGEPPVPEDAFGTQLSSSAPIAHARKWYADGVNFIGAADARLRITALCVPN